MLHTEPSFSVYADEDGSIDIKEGDLKVKEGSGEFSFAKNLSGFENLGIAEKEDGQIETVSINGVQLKQTSFNENGDVEDNYKRMVDEDPSNPVFLKNYAHLLQSNGDLNGAEEYYFLATQANPKDGEILMQYAKLLWELHHDQDRALGYFEAAVLAAPENCDVLAAYASFLWEIDEDEENNGTTAPVETKGDLEEYYSRAVKANPKDGEVVSQYAQFVWELHHDKDKASAYFDQALQAAPADSHVLAAYAKFLWEADDEDHNPEKL